MSCYTLTFESGGSGKKDYQFFKYFLLCLAWLYPREYPGKMATKTVENRVCGMSEKRRRTKIFELPLDRKDIKGTYLFFFFVTKMNGPIILTGTQSLSVI